ncbi:MAG TPA: hypothetical protein VJ987_04820 [Anaerolineales bacterium]|nr:hypothetical protein [Anaerolineales bacterium]
MPKRELDADIEIRHVPLPPEKRAAWDQAMQILTGKILDIVVIQVCSECHCELHLTTEGKQVCRNETCPNYS